MEVLCSCRNAASFDTGMSPNIIQGYINRTANSNGTPGIMGGKPLSVWLKKITSRTTI